MSSARAAVETAAKPSANKTAKNFFTFSSLGVKFSKTAMYYYFNGP